MTRYFMPVLFALITASQVNAQPRGAAMYSSFPNGQGMYKEEQVKVFEEAGISLDSYENINISQLATSLSSYDLVVFGTGYNYENPQDLGLYTPQLRDYIKAGGCLVVTDANYPQMNGWLETLDSGLRWGCRSEMNPSREGPVAWVNTSHPLMQGVAPLTVPWTQPAYWSQTLIPLVSDAARRPIVAYLEIGKGIVVVSSAYRQYSFPQPVFLNNLIAWTKDPERVAQAQKRQETAELNARVVPELSIPTLVKTPIIDGVVNEDEWRDATVISQFVAMDNSPNITQPTTCRIAQTANSFVIAFECQDSDISAIPHSITERDGAVWVDDCVEVFLDPHGEPNDYFHFAVNSIGTQYDERGGDAAWDRYWIARTNITPGMWTVEIEIPFTSLDITKTQAVNNSIRGNFYREYQGRGSMQLELSGWSPTFGNFGIRSRFGKLNGINIPADNYTLASELKLQTPEQWFSGVNEITVSASALKEDSIKFKLALMHLGTKQRINIADLHELAAGETVEIPLNLSLDTDQACQYQVVAVNPEKPDQILASSPVINAQAAPLLDIDIITPAFRGIVQSRDLDKTLRLAGFVAEPGVETGAMQLRTTLIPKGQARPVWQQLQATSPRSVVKIETSLADFPPAEYEIQVDLENATRQLLARKRMALQVCAPAPVEVTFDAKRACYVNGKPIFPIGLYHISEPALNIVNARAKEIGLPEMTLEELLTACKDHGFNTVVRSWGMPGEEYMEIAQRLGLMVMPEIGAPGETELYELLKFANRYDNLIMWYGIDEPNGDRLKIAVEAHERFAKVDIHRPVSAACNNPSTFNRGVQAYDLLMMDPYFIRNSSLEGIASWVEAGMKAGKGRMPIWVVPQAFAIDAIWSEPTCEEIRCQAYLSIVHGATGLIWYAWFTTETFSKNPKGRNQWVLNDSEMWPYFTKLNSEINELAPVILQGDAMGSVKCDNEKLHSQIWKTADASYLMVVNPHAQDHQGSFSELSGNTAEVMYENREMQIVNGMITDNFKPLEVHIYRIK